MKPRLSDWFNEVFFCFFLKKSQELPKIKNIEIQNLENIPPKNANDDKITLQLT